MPVETRQALQKSLSRIYKLVFHVTLTLSIMRFASPIISTFTSIRFDYIGILLLALITGMAIVIGGIREILQGFLLLLGKIKYLTWALVLYVLWDVIGFFRADTPNYVIEKYLYWAKIAAVVFFMLLYSGYFNKDKPNSSKDIQLNFGVTSVIMSLVSMWGYYSGQFMYREGIISPIKDHNTFAMPLVLGYLALQHYIFVYLERKFYTKLLFSTLTSFIVLSAIYFSGSRRSILSIALILFITFLFVVIRYKRLFRCWKQSLATILSIVLVSVGIYGHVQFFNDYQIPESRTLKRSIVDPDEAVDIFTIHKDEDASVIDSKMSGPNTKDYLSAVVEGTALTPRLKIWEASLKWIGDMDPLTIIVGGGSSYQFDVFDDLNHPYNKDVVEHYNYHLRELEVVESWMSPHNFLLDDFMSGGLIKLLLTVLAMAAIVIVIIRILPRSQGFLMIAMYFVLFSSMFLSGRNGLLGYQMTWLVLGFNYLLADDILHQPFQSQTFMREDVRHGV